MIVEGDFYDVVVYLSNLFSKKRLHEVEISGYVVRYSSFRCGGMTDQHVVESSEFPSSDQIEKVEEITLRVSGISHVPVTVSISWNKYSFDQDIGKERAENFIDSLDRSTFRYF